MLCRIGEVEVWRVLEDDRPVLSLARFFPDLGAEDLARLRPGLVPRAIRPDPETGEDWLVLPVQSFLLRTPRRTILVDACVGNDKTVPHIPLWTARRDGRFMAGLAQAGARVEDVDLVLCTHLHVDHVGWTTRREGDRWVPTFPNARVLTTAADLARAEALAEAGPDTTAGHVWRESLAPLVEAGRLEVVEPDAQADPAVRLRPAPGHTPGHVAVEILAGPGASSGASSGAVITGDLIHSPLQLALPDLCPSVDADPAQARATRRAMLEELAETRRLALVTHFPLPSAGRVRRAEGAFGWDDSP